jgi:hypothetical protein
MAIDQHYWVATGNVLNAAYALHPDRFVRARDEQWNEKCR